MLKFHKNIIQTCKEIPGQVSLLIHSLCGCPFHCVGCLNYSEIVTNKCEGLNEDQILNQINSMKNLITTVIFSGGEFLINNIDDIESFLIKVRSIFKGNLIIYSNGFYPEKIKRLFEEGLIDGIHMDLKLPYFSISGNNKFSKEIVGKVLSEEELLKVRESVKIVAKFDRGMSQFRTVKYPNLDDSIFDLIKKEVDVINKKFNSKIPWKLNQFILD